MKDMLISRRRFLKTLTVITVSTGLGVTLLPSMLPAPHRIARKLYNYWLIIDTSPGSLDTHTLQTLLTAAETLLNIPVEKRHYEDFFRWHAENLGGFKDIYSRITVVLDRSARQFHRNKFIDCNAAEKHKIIGKALNLRKSKVLKFWTGIFDKNWLLFEPYFVRPVHKLFTETDALILLGYDSWPGKPRGLVRYTQKPTGTGIVENQK